MATANNIPSQEEASHPHIREESERGRLFRRRHIGTAGEALQPSAISLDEESQDWKGADAKKGKRTDGGGLPILDLGTFKPVSVLSVRPDRRTGPSSILSCFETARRSVSRQREPVSPARSCPRSPSFSLSRRRGVGRRGDTTAVTNVMSKSSNKASEPRTYPPPSSSAPRSRASLRR